MLTELRIKNFAIIDDLALELDPGFLVFTGETGAGKSIIIDAVEMLLGGRADSTVVRTGADLAYIEGTFKLKGSAQEAVGDILAGEGLLEDPEHLVLGREVRREGRNAARINGRTVTLGMLREVGDVLVDVHGQSDHLSLLRVKEHLQLLDRYGEYDDLLQEYQRAYRELVALREEIRRLERSEQDAARRSELLAFQLNEIEAAQLRPGELEDLLEERTRLANAEKLTRLAEEARSALSAGFGRGASVSDSLGAAAEALEDLARIDPSMAELQGEAQALLETAGEISRSLRLYVEGIEFNPARLDQVEDRISLIHDLQRKYGGDIESVLAYGERAQEELEEIDTAGERLSQLREQEAEELQRTGELGVRLSEARAEAGERLSGEIMVALEDLRMEGARFQVEARMVEDPEGVPAAGGRYGFKSSGLDQVEFLIEPNPGEGLQPLVKTASGGETSRMMLGLKGVLADADQTPTLIFDEIDQGIGGRVGAIVGRRLWRLAQSHQVLCITHLPQLAAFGDRHYRVEKDVRQGRTVTLAYPLEGADRLTELAVMLGGETEANLQSAEELLAAARVEKGVEKERV